MTFLNHTVFYFFITDAPCINLAYFLFQLLSFFFPIGYSFHNLFMVGQLRRKLCPFDLAVITAVADRQVLVCRITAYTPGNSMFYIVFIGIKKDPRGL